MTVCRRTALLSIAVLMSLFCAACSHRAPHYFSYLDTPAEAQLSGTLGEVDFTARLTSGGRAAVAGALPLGCDFSLTYHSPTALAGVRVDYAAATGEITVSLGSLKAQGTSGREAYAALAAPGVLLLTESAVQSTTAQSDGSHLIVTADGARRLLSADGTPISLTQTADGRRVAVEVVSMERR